MNNADAVEKVEAAIANDDLFEKLILLAEQAETGAYRAHVLTQQTTASCSIM